MTFDSFDAPSQSEVHHASAAVVFTGSFARLDEGLRLVNSGAVPRLYISGFNAEAGLLPSNFLDQFSQRNPSIANLQLLVKCCVEWGVRAANTLQNAQDTRCWIERRGLTGALLLITSRQHMARAMVALSAALPSHVIVPYPADDEIPPTDRLRGRALEYVKYLTTFFAVHWPGSFQGRYGPFAQFCMRGIDETDARKNRGEPKPAAGVSDHVPSDIFLSKWRDLTNASARSGDRRKSEKANA